jgi:hypothetical protein
MVLNIVSELAVLQGFKDRIIASTNRFLEAYGKDDLPPFLYILSKYGSMYNFDNVRVNATFVHNIINGFDFEVIAFSYVHRLMVSEMDANEMLKMFEAGVNLSDVSGVVTKMAVYYEDRLLKKTSYHSIDFDTHHEIYVVNREPFSVEFNERHPAMMNLSGLYSIN